MMADREWLMVKWLMAMLLTVTLIAAGSCCVEAKPVEWIKIGKDGKSFVFASSGKAFVPRGFNYDRDADMRLLEDYWETDWPKVEQDFAEMKALGANVVRVHLQFGRFMQSANKPNAKALDRLEKLVSLAERTGLYLDITGLACYKKEHIPVWYDKLSEKDRWRSQAVFWEAIATRCANHPGILCYDLMNEPVVPSETRKSGEWLTGEFGGFYYVQFISLDQQDRPRTEIARDWLKTMRTAIRKHDKRHLITVGMLPWESDDPAASAGFLPKEIAREVDYLSVHVYPDSKNMQASLNVLKRFSVGKPLVIEEVFPMHCSIPELRQFLKDSEKYAQGWIGFYWGKTPDEYRKSTSIADTITLAWLELFQKMVKPSASRTPQ